MSPAYGKRAQVGAPREKKPARLGESDKGREAREQWQRERDAHLALHPSCQRPSLGGVACGGPVQVHHITPRGSGGTRGATGPLVTLCRDHHAWAESHRIEARDAGLLIRRRPHMT